MGNLTQLTNPRGFSTAFGYDADDLLISVSLLRADSTAQPEATRIFLDGTDITDRAVMSGDLLVVPPGAAGIPLVPGKHTVTVRLVNSTGEVYRSAALDFYVAGTGADAVEAAPPQAQLPAGPFYRGSVMLESRNESIGGVTTWYNRGGLNGSATYGDWTALGNLFITSDEDPDRQPQNRYYVGVTSPWLSAGYGDSYPLLSNLILSGKRVRGPHASLRLGAFNPQKHLGLITKWKEFFQMENIPALKAIVSANGWEDMAQEMQISGSSGETKRSSRHASRRG